MLRKTEKKIKRKKPKPSREKKDSYAWNYFLRNSNITHSSKSVIKSWRLPHRRCPTASSGRSTLVEIHGKHKTTLGTKLVYKSYAETPYPLNPNAYRASVLVTGECTPAFAFSISSRSKSVPWTAQNCNIEEPYDPSQNMQFFNVVESEGRFYAISLQGSVVVIEEEVVDSGRFGITRIGRNRAVPSKPCREFNEYLFESHGEIFAVFLMSTKSMTVVDDVEVFRLDTEKLLWAQTGNIGERAFFLDDDNCVEFEGSEKGFKKSCIYFTHSEMEEWFVYDMDTLVILPALELKIQTQE